MNDEGKCATFSGQASFSSSLRGSLVAAGCWVAEFSVGVSYAGDCSTRPRARQAGAETRPRAGAGQIGRAGR